MVSTTEELIVTVCPSLMLGAFKWWERPASGDQAIKDAAGMTSWDSVWRT